MCPPSQMNQLVYCLMKKKEVILTDEQMANLALFIKMKYPYTQRKNDIYRAEATTTWRVTIDAAIYDEVADEL